MVSDERHDPQRRSTRPTSGQAPQWRPTGSNGEGVRRDPRPGSIPPRSRGLREYEQTAAEGRTRSGKYGTGSQRTGSQRTASQRTTGSQRRSVDRNGRPIPRWKQSLQKFGKGALIAGLATALVGFLALVIRYQMLDVPAPSNFALIESSTVYYADGSTVMGRLGEADRDIVDFTTLPDHVGQAFVAAEDRSFYTNPGVDAGGTARALFKTIVLGKKQGGSTITQQYVERYYAGQTTTDIVGKIDEALLALKIDSQQEKDEILGNYINTVYFGRGAYGIEAAARKYYGKHASELTVSEVALLAGILPAPSAWDPRFSPEQAEFRWGYVLDGMVDLGFITQADRDLMTFPSTIEFAGDDVFGGAEGYLLRTALDEVMERTGITQEEIETQGLSIVTTFDPAAQQSVVDAMALMPEGAAPNLRVAAVVMDPGTGAVRAMYGGADYLVVQRNAVTQDIAQAGSTFKPFALVAALEQGIGLGSIYNGDQPMTVPGFENQVRNFGFVDYGDIDLVKATASSVNTVYAQLNMEVGPGATRDVAIRAGMPEDTVGLEDNPSNVLGTASPHAIDLAHAYSTFATGGVRTEPFTVVSVTRANGDIFYEHPVVHEQVFDSAVMADATYAMQQVVNYGSGKFASELGRPIAGKTGTSNDNRSAWFVGFTPNLVGVVGLYQVGPNGEAEEITPFGGFDQITGGSVPVRLWTWMMGPILSGMEVVDFPPRANVGVDTSPTPSASASPSPSPSASPTPLPTVTPTPLPTVTPTPTAGPLLPLPLP